MRRNMIENIRFTATMMADDILAFLTGIAAMLSRSQSAEEEFCG